MRVSYADTLYSFSAFATCPWDCRTFPSYKWERQAFHRGKQFCMFTKQVLLWVKLSVCVWVLHQVVKAAMASRVPQARRAPALQGSALGASLSSSYHVSPSYLALICLLSTQNCCHFHLSGGSIFFLSLFSWVFFLCVFCFVLFLINRPPITLGGEIPAGRDRGCHWHLPSLSELITNADEECFC